MNFFKEEKVRFGGFIFVSYEKVLKSSQLLVTETARYLAISSASEIGK